MKLSAATAGLLLWISSPAMAQQNGAALYAQHCAECHDSGGQQSRAPGRSVMQSMSFEHVVATLASGSMAAIAKERTVRWWKAGGFGRGGSPSSTRTEMAEA